ncbi:hypothetical protein MBGDC06_00508 [Thermoplasmatales archaeon SCGC AB-539-C06]|nr:hypothetical protein MBGDC06_00508 [Thermoplasmatales archaeon SCGC AB-539-C06]
MTKEAKEERKKVIPFIEGLDEIERGKQKLINAEGAYISSIQDLEKSQEKVDAYLRPIIKEIAKKWHYNKSQAEKVLEIELRKTEDQRFKLKDENLGSLDKNVQDKIRQLKKYKDEFMYRLPDINSRRKKAGAAQIELTKTSITKTAVNIALIKEKDTELTKLRGILTNARLKGLKERQEAISKDIESILEHKEKVQTRLIKKRIEKLESKEETPKIKALIDALNKFLQSIEAFKQQRYIPLKKLIDEKFLKLLNQEILRIDFISAGVDVAANANSLKNNYPKQQQLFEEEKNHFNHLRVTKKFEEELAKFFDEEAEAVEKEISKEDIDSLIDSKKFDKAEKKLRDLEDKTTKIEDPDKKQQTTIIIKKSYEKLITKMTEEADEKYQEAIKKEGKEKEEGLKEVIEILEKAIKLAKEKKLPVLEAGLKMSIKEIREGRIPTGATVSLTK